MIEQRGEKGLDQYHQHDHRDQTRCECASKGLLSFITANTVVSESISPKELPESFPTFF